MTHFSNKELVQRAIARRQITVAPPLAVSDLRHQSKGVWTEEAKLKQSEAQKERYEKTRDKRSASARAHWTPERRAAHSAWLKKLYAARRAKAPTS